MRSVRLLRRAWHAAAGALLPAFMLVLSALPVGAATPTFTSGTEGPFTWTPANCGSYRILETYTVKWRTIHYADGSSRIHSSLVGSLSRTDQPGTIIGRERATSVAYIRNSISRITGSTFRIFINGYGMALHDVGQVMFRLDGFVLLRANGKHPIWTGSLDPSETLCRASRLAEA